MEKVNGGTLESFIKNNLKKIKLNKQVMQGGK